MQLPMKVSEMQLPMKVSEITPAWLSEALSERWPGIEVTEVKYDDSIAGTATKVKLTVKYAERKAAAKSDGPPPTFYIKFGLSQFQLETVANLGIYDNEVFAYSKILPAPGFAFSFPKPDCYFAAFQQMPIQGVMLLEDLTAKQVSFNSALRPLNSTQVKTALEALAQLHGKSWESPLLAPVLPALEPVLKLYTNEVAISAKLFGLLRGHVVPFTYRNLERYTAAWTRYVELVRSGPQCLLHGDSHMGNSFTQADGRIGFLDWQLMCKGRWIQDVAYYIVSALDVENRQNLEKDLLKHYLAELGKYGVKAPGFAEAFEDYRKAILYSLVVWLGNPDICQPPAINLTCLARTSHALMDLKTFEALGV